MKVLRYFFIVSIISLSPKQLYANVKSTDNADELVSMQPQESLLSAATIQKALQNPHFADEIFPNDFSCLYGLLSLGKNVEYAPAFGSSVLTTFRHLLHSSPYINVYCMRDLLRDLPEILQGYIGNKIENEETFFDSIKKSVNNLLYSRFTNEYEIFKKSPQQFLTNLAGDIAIIAIEDMSVTELQSQVVRFLELAISKLIWSPEEYRDSWVLVKSMSNSLAVLVDKNILTNINHYNDLSWALVKRYVDFLSIFADSIPSSFYQEVRVEIAQKNLVLFGLDNDNGGSAIESKYAFLNRKLFENEARSRGIEKGVIR